MENKKILSISVAAYNLEKFIEQNLKSFVNTKYRNDIEVLVIDDESKDKTPQIIEHYQRKYPNTIKLIRQKNAGPGSTINTALDNATGKYFRTVDGDDWVNSENLDKLIEVLKGTDVDMIITNHERYNEYKKKVVRIEKADLPNNEIQKFAEICNKLYLQMPCVSFRTSIFKENKIKIDNGFYTDVEYTLYPIPYIKTVLYLDFTVYISRLGRAGQSTNIKSMQKHIKDHDIVLNSLIKFYEENKQNLNDDSKKYLSRRISKMAWTQINVLLTLKNDKNMKKDIKELILRIKSNSIDIYNNLKEIKYVRWIINSNYKAVTLLSMLRLLKIKILQLEKRL